jgi:single-stranded-DNA-specific exonuclease RecJ
VMNQLTFTFEESPPENLPAVGIPLPSNTVREPHTLGLEFLTKHPPTPRSISVMQPSEDAISRAKEVFGTIRDPLLLSLLTAMLVNRGWDSVEQLHLLHQGLDALPPVSLLKNFDLIVDRICSAISKREPIAVVGDYDVDGITSVAKLGQLLSLTETPHMLRIPNRAIDGFGISERLTEEILQGHPETGKQFSLVVLVDHGSQAHRYINQLRARGIDSIVIDHHQVTGALPEALVLNPRQPGCGWGQHAPCAGALTDRVVATLCERLHLPCPDQGLTAIATIADMSPLTANSFCNRIFAGVGLQHLRTTKNVGIRALAHAAGIKAAQSNPDLIPFTSSDIAFTLGPILNAQGRLGDANLCVELLTTNDPERASDIAHQLVQNNIVRKKLEGRMLVSELERISHLPKLPDLIGRYHSTHHLGLIGLIAQRLAQRWARPSIVAAPNNHGFIVSSSRAGELRYNVFHLLSTADSLSPPGSSPFVRFGGHAPAGGCTVHDETSFAQAVSLLESAYSSLGYTPTASVPLIADCELRLDQLTPELFDRCEALLEPFGNGFASPQILIRGVRVDRITPPRHCGGRFKLRLSQKGAKLDALLGTELWDTRIDYGTVMDIVATPLKLYRNQQRFMQLSIAGYTISKVARQPRALPSPQRSEADHQRSKEEAPQLTMLAPGIRARALYRSLQTQNQSAPERSPVSTSAQIRRSAQPEALRKKLATLHSLQGAFDSRFLYPDLEALNTCPFSSSSPPSTEHVWSKLCSDYGLDFDYSKLELRPAALEFIRYFFETGGSHILQAPTGTGKTIVSLMIASHFIKAGRRVLFVAPTREIAQQALQESYQILGKDVPRLLLIGGMPKQRSEQLRSFTSGLLVGTAATSKNDLDRGGLCLSEKDLLIVDEVHHAKGRRASVSIIEHAKKLGARRLLASATPWQVKKQETEATIRKLRELTDAQTFPYNSPPLENKTLVQFCTLTPTMQAADSLLRYAMTSFQTALRESTEVRILETTDALRACFRPNIPNTIQNLNTEKLDALRNSRALLDWIRPQTREQIDDKAYLSALLELHKEISRTLKQRDQEYVSLNKVRALTANIAETLGYRCSEYWSVRGAMELAYLHRILVNEGIPGFLLRCLEKRCGVLFPKLLGEGERASSWGQHVTDLYVGWHSHFVAYAFKAVSPPACRSLWSRAGLEALFGISTHEWRGLSASQKVKAFKTGFAAVKARVMEGCDSPDFFAHPAEEFILTDITRHRQKSFIWVDKVEQVKWLRDHMQRQLEPSAMSVVGLTGSGRAGTKGMSGRQRDAALRAFRNDPDTRVIIGTTTLNEGIDARGYIGYERSLKGSFIQHTQKAGRPGRHDRRGEMITLCTIPQQYRTLLSNIDKCIENQKILNALRAEIVALHRDSTSESVTPQTSAETSSTPQQKWLF